MGTKISLWIAKLWHKQMFFCGNYEENRSHDRFSLIFKIVIGGYHLGDVVRDIETQIVP